MMKGVYFILYIIDLKYVNDGKTCFNVKLGTCKQLIYFLLFNNFHGNKSRFCNFKIKYLKHQLKIIKKT